MARPVTLFTGQWADLTLEELAEKASGWGYDGLELACWGDHFEVDKALAEDSYCQADTIYSQNTDSKFGQSVITLSDRQSATILTADIKASYQRRSGATEIPQAFRNVPPKR